MKLQTRQHNKKRSIGLWGGSRGKGGRTVKEPKRQTKREKKIQPEGNNYYFYVVALCYDEMRDEKRGGKGVIVRGTWYWIA